jgi:hypothetical protein
MQLQQIKIEFSAEQDRLLMRLASGDRAEILLWLTRRCVRLLWPLLVKMAESTPRIALQPTPEARHALLDMEREQALAKADFSSPYQEVVRERPLGAEPLLIARINIGQDKQGKHVLTLRPTEGQGVNIAMDDTMLHGLCKVLQDSVDKAQWDMKLALPSSNVPGVAGGATPTLN